MAIIELARAFRFGVRDLPDPAPSMTPQEVLVHYSSQYPKLIGGKVLPAKLEGDTQVYEMKALYGDKG